MSRRSLFRQLQWTLYWLLPCLAYGYWMWRLPHVQGADLIPVPDAQEYAWMALRLAQFKAPLISIGLFDYPARYSLSYPLLLAPFAWIFQFDTARFYLASMVFGLLTIVLIARSGRWLLGSRLAGGLAALFFALHPQTLWSGTVNMSESGMLMMFFLLLNLARPWLEESKADPTASQTNRAEIWRALAVGLAAGWLTVAKAPFVYWALVMTALVAARALDRRRFAPLLALVLGGGVWALADVLYRRWSLGSWGTNGYAYWVPKYYMELTTTFNWRYLFEPINPLTPNNAVGYGIMLLGWTNEFYARPLALVAAVSGIALLWPRRRGRPGWLLTGLMAGWLIVGFLFCGLYFFQSPRFPHLWVPIVDLVAAWGVVWLPCFLRRRSRLLRGFNVRLCAQAAILLVAVLLARGEWRRIGPLFAQVPERVRERPYVEHYRPLLAKVPKGAWLLTNYQQPQMELDRPHPGPTGSLFIFYLDNYYMNGHVANIGMYDLAPSRGRSAKAWPSSWRKGPAVLIDADKQWGLKLEERRALFSRPVYLLLVCRRDPAVTADYIDRVIMPMLRKELKLETVASRGEAILLKATWAAPGTPGLPKVPGLPKGKDEKNIAHQQR